MDDVSMRTMGDLVNRYVLHRSDILSVLDVGSQDVQGIYGNYSSFFQGPGYVYMGLDIEAGNNVHIVVEDPYDWGINGTFDLVISGQCLEHVEYPWLTMEQIAKSLKPGGLHFNIVPSTGPVHRFPIDTYRYHPDGMNALCKWADLDVLELSSRNDSIWCNTVVVARKPGA